MSLRMTSLSELLDTFTNNYTFFSIQHICIRNNLFRVLMIFLSLHRWKIAVKSDAKHEWVCYIVIGY